MSAALATCAPDCADARGAAVGIPTTQIAPSAVVAQRARRFICGLVMRSFPPRGQPPTGWVCALAHPRQHGGARVGAGPLPARSRTAGTIQRIEQKFDRLPVKPECYVTTITPRTPVPRAPEC